MERSRPYENRMDQHFEKFDPMSDEELAKRRAHEKRTRREEKKRWGEKGIAPVLIVAAVAAISLVMVALTPIGALFGISHGQKQTVTRQSTTVEPALDAQGKPLYVRDAQGNVAPLMKTVTSSFDETSAPKLSLWQRIKGLGFAAIFLYILALVFFPGAVHIFNQRVVAFWKKEHANLKTEAQRIVLSVDDGLKAFDASIKAHEALANNATDGGLKLKYQEVTSALSSAKAAFLAEMEKTQDQSTKTLYTSLKETSPTPSS